jgi:hypothetical protein
MSNLNSLTDPNRLSPLSISSHDEGDLFNPDGDGVFDPDEDGVFDPDEGDLFDPEEIVPSRQRNTQPQPEREYLEQLSDDDDDDGLYTKGVSHFDEEELDEEVHSWKIQHSTGDHKLQGMETFFFFFFFFFFFLIRNCS